MKGSSIFRGSKWKRKEHTEGGERGTRGRAEISGEGNSLATKEIVSGLRLRLLTPPFSPLKPLLKNRGNHTLGLLGVDGLDVLDVLLAAEVDGRSVVDVLGHEVEDPLGSRRGESSGLLHQHGHG